MESQQLEYKKSFGKEVIISLVAFAILLEAGLLLVLPTTVIQAVSISAKKHFSATRMKLKLLPILKFSLKYGLKKKIEKIS